VHGTYPSRVLRTEYLGLRPEPSFAHFDVFSRLRQFHERHYRTLSRMFRYTWTASTEGF
jgi:hypothetical protein